jgi:hypothetical protein
MPSFNPYLRSKINQISQIKSIPYNEFERLLALSEFDLDYTELDHTFSDLTTLAAKVAGTDISLIKLIDSFTQWSECFFLWNGYPTNAGRRVGFSAYNSPGK